MGCALRSQGTLSSDQSGAEIEFRAAFRIREVAGSLHENLEMVGLLLPLPLLFVVCLLVLVLVRVACEFA